MIGVNVTQMKFSFVYVFKMIYEEHMGMVTV